MSNPVKFKCGLSLQHGYKKTFLEISEQIASDYDETLGVFLNLEDMDTLIQKLSEVRSPMHKYIAFISENPMSDE